MSVENAKFKRNIHRCSLQYKEGYGAVTKRAKYVENQSFGKSVHWIDLHGRKLESIFELFPKVLTDVYCGYKYYQES